MPREFGVIGTGDGRPGLTKYEGYGLWAIRVVRVVRVKGYKGNGSAKKHKTLPTIKKVTTKSGKSSKSWQRLTHTRSPSVMEGLSRGTVALTSVMNSDQNQLLYIQSSQGVS